MRTEGSRESSPDDADVKGPKMWLECPECGAEGDACLFGPDAIGVEIYYTCPHCGEGFLAE